MEDGFQYFCLICYTKNQNNELILNAEKYTTFSWRNSNNQLSYEIKQELLRNINPLTNFYQMEYDLINVRPVEYHIESRTPPKNVKPHTQETPTHHRQHKKNPSKNIGKWKPIKWLLCDWHALSMLIFYKK